MRYFLSKIISLFRGESFIIDEKIPVLYLFHSMSIRFLYLVYGFFYFHKLNCFISPSSTLRCRNMIKARGLLLVGPRCNIDALSEEGLFLGMGVSIGRNTTIECTGSLKCLGKGIKIGDNVGLGTHGFWGGAGGIEVGNDTIFGNYVSLHSENHNYADLDIPIRLQGVNRKGIKIGNNCWIGAKVTILDGTVLGNGCIVAAGAVVRGTFPDNAVIGGVPAKILKMRK